MGNWELVMNNRRINLICVEVILKQFCFSFSWGKTVCWDCSMKIKVVQAYISWWFITYFYKWHFFDQEIIVHSKMSDCLFQVVGKGSMST